MSTKATMTRQHFQLIAEVLREALAQRLHNGEPVGSTPKERARYAAQVDAIKDVASDFALRLARTNDGFRREQFLAATDPSTEYKPKRVSSNQHRARTASRPVHFGQAPGYEREPYSSEETTARLTAAYAGEVLDFGAEGSEE